MVDFSAKVASLLSSCSAVVAAIPRPAAVSELPSEADMEAILYRALDGDVEAQVEMSNICLQVGKTVGGTGDPYIENAETWARKAAEAGSERGEYSLAVVLLYRAGMLAPLGFRRLSGEVAAEAMGLLEMLADDGFEQAACSLVTATEALAMCGISASPYAKQEGF